MSSYTTLAALSTRVGGDSQLAQLADDINATPDIADATTIANINQAITDASTRIDMILQGCLDMSNSDVLSTVEPAAAYIAIFLLYARRQSEDTNPYYTYYRDTIRDLREIAKGVYHVSSDPLPATSITTNVSSRTRVLGRATDTDDPLGRL